MAIKKDGGGLVRTRLEGVEEKAFYRYLKEYMPYVDIIKLYKTGYPDRCVLIGMGTTIFIEFKRKGIAARKRQLHEVNELRKKGYVAEVVVTNKEAQTILLDSLDSLTRNSVILKSALKFMSDTGGFV